MAKTRPGVDRITKQRLQAEHAYALRQRNKHMRLCGQCSKSGDNLYMRCIDWWHLAKTERRTAKALREYKQPETQGMIPLFGVELCDPPPF